ncbi:hypothetical protein DOE63_08635 [Salmonella enterica subsp. diarizonae serovar 59:z10:-]|nr:hypothetical protein DOE63_08635 [Salmonella enterica subsp. diarizonae serovar 59:z10:-]
MLVTAFVCVACFILSLLISYFKTKTSFFGMNPIINRDELCSSNVIVLNNHLALRYLIWNKSIQPSAYGLTFSFFNCIPCF